MIQRTWMSSAPSAALARSQDLLNVIRMFSIRGWLLALAGALVTLLLIGIPTAVISNPLFTRMTPVRPQDYMFWVATAVVSGLVVGTYALGPESKVSGKAVSGVLLADLAVGCPICNKVVVLLLGVSGALNFFEPFQFYLGLFSLGLLSLALVVRARAVVASCQLTPQLGSQIASS